MTRMDWTGFQTCRFDLARPLLIVRGGKGVLGCGYLDIATLNTLGEAGAIVRGVGNFDDMLAADVVAASEAALALGVRPGMSGRQALERFR